jgi:tRNA (guanine-N7-)-methyltransferase
VQGNSRSVTSNQPHVHQRLAAMVQRHVHSPSLRPVAEHSRQSFAPLLQRCPAQPIILDSFCGTGQSSTMLAQANPGSLVVGVDQSAARLSRCTSPERDNLLLLQADCEDVWRLLLENKIDVAAHFLLYPNPWPKSKHLQRRVHGSAALPLLLQMGGKIELRSNWQIYVEEFALALQLCGHPGVVGLLPEQPALTLFEQKYRDSGHQLWRFMGSVNAKTGTVTNAL